jgi:hypothetical protein
MQKHLCCPCPSAAKHKDINEANVAVFEVLVTRTGSPASERYDSSAVMMHVKIECVADKAVVCSEDLLHMRDRMR